MEQVTNVDDKIPFQGRNIHRITSTKHLESSNLVSQQSSEETRIGVTGCAQVYILIQTRRVVMSAQSQSIQTLQPLKMIRRQSQRLRHELEQNLPQPWSMLHILTQHASCIRFIRKSTYETLYHLVMYTCIDVYLQEEGNSSGREALGPSRRWGCYLRLFKHVPGLAGLGSRRALSSSTSWKTQAARNMFCRVAMGMPCFTTWNNTHLSDASRTASTIADLRLGSPWLPRSTIGGCGDLAVNYWEWWSLLDMRKIWELMFMWKDFIGQGNYN